MFFFFKQCTVLINVTYSMSIVAGLQEFSTIDRSTYYVWDVLCSHGTIRNRVVAS